MKNPDINLKELEEFKKKNFQERLDFVDKWSKYVLEHDDKTWSKQQNVIINSIVPKTADIKIKIVETEYDSFSVDTPEDLEKALSFRIKL